LLLFFITTSSGKTSFLTALAKMSAISSAGNLKRFHVATDPAAIVLSDISIQDVGYLQQHDDFFDHLTVYETLQLASYLELPTLNQRAREQQIRQVVQQLGLQTALHRRVGDRSAISFNAGPPKKQSRGNKKKTTTNPWLQMIASDRGRLSGGERRRLSVALELLTAKQILIADEPTSGLDSAFSDTVVKLLKDLAQLQNIPAVASLHQPRSSIWNRLDSVILMAPGGRICYAGDRHDVVEYFKNLGYPLPPNTNPAEYLLDLVSIDSEDMDKAVQDEARIARFERIFRHRAIAPGQVSAYTLQIEDTESWKTMWTRKKSLLRWIPRLGALLQRSWRQNIRDTGMNVLRLIISIGNAVLLAGIFPTVKAPGPLVSSIADRVALLSFAAINLTMLAYMKSVTLFSRERRVVQREQTREQYSAFEYLVAKFLAEMPLDAAFSILFSATLKHFSGLMIPFRKLAHVFVGMTVAGASLGYLLGSLAPQNEASATTAGIPILVVLMIGKKSYCRCSRWNLTLMMLRCSWCHQSIRCRRIATAPLVRPVDQASFSYRLGH
jgi:ABC-type multidrug transport system ATPase subunit